MSDRHTGHAVSDEARIPYESVGDGPSVVFIHAGIADSRMWDPQFDSASDGFRLVRLDLQGYGGCELAGTEFSNHDDVIAVLDHLAIDSAVIVGCSMGGGTALDVALAAPDMVSGLVLIGAWSPGFEPPEYVPPQWPEAVKAFKAGDFHRGAELDAEMWVIGYGRTIDDVDRSVFDLVIEMDQVPLSNETKREKLTVSLEPPAQGRMGEISVPTLVVVGEHDLPDIRAAAVDLAEKLGEGEAVVIPGAAHLPNLEQPEAFNRALADFLHQFR